MSQHVTVRIPRELYENTMRFAHMEDVTLSSIIVYSLHLLFTPFPDLNKEEKDAKHGKL